MKTKPLNLNAKSLLLASAMVAAVVAVSPRQAYANVVGYANVPLTNGYNFVADQLDLDGTGTNNTLNSILGTNYVSGTKVYVWDVPTQVFLTPPSTCPVGTSDWNPNYNVPAGKGFVIWSNTNSTMVTFVGQVLQGTLINPVAGTNKFSLLGNMIPIAGPLTNYTAPPGLGFPAIDGANAFTFDAVKQRYSSAFTFLNPLGWADAAGIVGTNGPVIGVGQAFFVQNPGPDTNWTQVFTVDAPSSPNLVLPSQKSLVGAAQIASPVISHTSVNSGQVTLQIGNPGGATFSVQFSPDGSGWTTLAASQTGTAWSGPLPSSQRGYFRLTTP